MDASIPIIQADVLRVYGAELRTKRMREVTNELLEEIINSVTEFDGCLEVRYRHDYLNPPMTHDLVESFRAAGYRAYYHDAGHHIYLIIVWDDTVTIPKRYYRAT